MNIKIVILTFLFGLQLQSISAEVNNKEVYFVIFDAGSSGTRVQVFNFHENKESSFGFDFKNVTKQSSKPGLTAFVNEPSRVKEGITKLLSFAKQVIPQAFHRNTWCIVRATAGFRLISSEARNRITTHIEDVFHRSPFKIPETDAVKMISGKEEALFAWISINIITKTFQNKKPTYPVLEIGGGSLQFATQVSSKTGDDNEITFKLPSGVEYHIHLHSYLGLGQQESVLKTSGYQAGSGDNQELSNVCLAKDFQKEFSFGNVKVQLVGDKIKDDDRRNQCKKKSYSLVESLHVHSEKQYVKPSQPIYCLSGAYYVIKALRQKYSDLKITKINERNLKQEQLNHRTYNLQVKTLEKAGRIVCADIPKDDDKYWPFYCLYINVMTAFLRCGIETTCQQHLKAIGENDAIGWTLGLSLHYLTKDLSILQL